MSTPGYPPTPGRIASLNGGLLMMLVAGLLMTPLSPTASAQTPLSKTASGNTCEFGEPAYAASCAHANGIRGQLGREDYGVYGQAGSTYGFLGGIHLLSDFGVYGEHSDGNVGWLGHSSYGVYGEHTNGNKGHLGGSQYGAYGRNDNGNVGYVGGSSFGAFGLHSVNGNQGWLGGSQYGVYGQNDTGNWGSLGGSFYGTNGRNDNDNRGYLGHDSYGVWGTGSPWAGYFVGNVHVTGTLSKAGGSFKIDHPLDPENQYLSHSFVESPDMMNVYNGNVTTDANGEAVVELPSYFEVLNRDFRYGLTVIGQFAQAIVAQEIQGNRFVIRTDQPDVKVSWLVTGIRQDAWAEANRIVVEEAKPAAEQGFYLHPALYGQPAERSIEWALDPEGMRAIQEMPARLEAERQRMEAERERIRQ